MLFPWKKIQLVALVVSAAVAFGVGCWARLVFSSVHEKSNYYHASEEARLAFPPKINSVEREPIQQTDRSDRKIELTRHRDFFERVEASAAIGISAGDVAHWEALVHPAMISHGGPRRVGILGNDFETRHVVENLQTLNEVLKHNSVEEILMFGVSESGLEYESCEAEWRDDVDVTCFSDGIGWFLDNFRDPSQAYNEGNVTEGDRFEFYKSTGTGSEGDSKRKFDVIIIYNLMEQNGFFVIESISASSFQSFLNGLSDNGVLALALHGSIRHVVNLLDVTGFSSIQVYQENHSKVKVPSRNYVIAFKNFDSRSEWYQNAAEIEIVLHYSITDEQPNGHELNYFDARTMVSYQTPHRTTQDDFCVWDPSECEDYVGFDPMIRNLPTSVLKVAKSSVGENAGRGLFASMMIPQGTGIGLNEQVQSFHLPPSSTDIVEMMMYEEDHINETDYDSFTTFFYGYGYAISHVMGGTLYFVDSGRQLFANHGCNGTDNYGPLYKYSETTVDLNSIPEGFFSTLRPFNPVIERHLRQFMCSDQDVTSRNIEEGEEIFTNYLEYSGGNLDDWKEDVLSLRGQCTGESVGDITGYEIERQ